MERYQDSTLAPELRAADLLRHMTLREKVGQLTQRLYGFACYRREGEEITLTREFRDEVARYGGLGALYGLHRADPWSGRNFETGLPGVLAVRARNQVQRYVLEHSRLGIPVLFSSESPHGHQALDGYLLPVNLACGCTFSPALLEAADRGVSVRILVDGISGRLRMEGKEPFLLLAEQFLSGYRQKKTYALSKQLEAAQEEMGG